MLGKSTLEAARILSICETLKELAEAFSSLVPFGSTPTAEALDTFFTGGAKDATGPAGSDRTRYLTWFLGRLEAQLTGNGVAVGSDLSLADVSMFSLFCDNLTASDVFCSKERTDAAIAAFPKISASVTAVAANANIQKWLATRGPQGF